MRDELARTIRERVGLDEATSLQVADVAIQFLQEKLPPGVARLLTGGQPDLGQLGGMLGGRFGGRKEEGTRGPKLPGRGGRVDSRNVGPPTACGRRVWYL